MRHLSSDQRGQDMVEYAGVLLVVTVVVAMVATFWQSFGPTFAHDVQCLVEKILGHGCGAPSGPAYPVSASVKTVGYDGRVGIVRGGHSYTITLTKLSNGTSTITVVDNGKLGVSAEWGANVELGPLGSAGADASIGGGGYGDKTSTWTLPTWAQGQRDFNQISQGSALGLTAHDLVANSAGALPGVGGLATGLFDSITGASGAPSSGSLPHKYLTSTSTGAGVQGSGEAGAHADFGPLQAGVNASLEASGGLQHINSGAQKGDWQLSVSLDGNADGALANWLFGAQADIAGNVTRQATVTFSPSGAPLTLDVIASGDKVWDVAPPSNLRVDVPNSSSTGNGTSSQGGEHTGGAANPGGSKPSGESGKEPLLTVQNDTSGGSGQGSVFTGTLDLQNNPQAQQDVSALLQGDPSGLGDLSNQMNTRGTETLQTYQITRSNSTVGGGVSAGAGFAASLSDGTSRATYNPPKTRENGGKWHNAP